MPLDKKQIALTVGGILAGLTLTYLLYRLEQNNAAANAQSETDAANAQQSELANQQAQFSSLPSISVPTISATPSPTDTTNQGQVSAVDPTLEAFLAAALSADNTAVTSATSPVATITQLPFPTQNVIPAVVIPELQTFGSTASPISVPFHAATRQGS